MKIKPPFAVTFNDSTSSRVWGYGLGYFTTHAPPAKYLAWGYNVRGQYIALPFAAMWRWIRGRGYQISNPSAEVQS
jgi:hypothetical protein